MRGRKAVYFFIACCLGVVGIFGIDPESLLPFWADVESERQAVLLPQLESFNLREIESQRKLIAGEESSSGILEPFTEYRESGSTEDEEFGKKLLVEGKVGCLIVAGGQGTRLNHTSPKGLFPVTLIRKKSLFQLFAEKILAAGRRAGRPLSVAVMTSPANHEETVRSFKENHFFGLNSDQISFFSQEEIPLLDTQGNLFLETPYKIARGSDGNASSLKHFVRSGVWEEWDKQGICYLNYLHIDNPLADPFDAELSGYHAGTSSDMVMKCIARKNPSEKVGVVVKQDGKIRVVEYSEISAEERDAESEEGALKHLCANIGMYSFSMDFVKRVASDYYDRLPFHKAFKAAKKCTPNGESVMTKEPSAWKFEKFIFDVLEYAVGVKALLAPGEDCFAPLKNATGDDSLEQVQQALLSFDRRVFSRISGLPVPEDRVFELDPLFYYPTETLLRGRKGKSLPDHSYIQ